MYVNAQNGKSYRIDRIAEYERRYDKKIGCSYVRARLVDADEYISITDEAWLRALVSMTTVTPAAPGTHFLWYTLDGPPLKPPIISEVLGWVLVDERVLAVTLDSIPIVELGGESEGSIHAFRFPNGSCSIQEQRFDDQHQLEFWISERIAKDQT